MYFQIELIHYLIFLSLLDNMVAFRLRITIAFTITSFCAISRVQSNIFSRNTARLYTVPVY